MSGRFASLLDPHFSHTWISFAAFTALGWLFFFLMIRRPPRSTLFPTRRSSDLARVGGVHGGRRLWVLQACDLFSPGEYSDRKSTRLNSSHMSSRMPSSA